MRYTQVAGWIEIAGSRYDVYSDGTEKYAGGC
jgi:hypothetical protein